MHTCTSYHDKTQGTLTMKLILFILRMRKSIHNVFCVKVGWQCLNVAPNQSTH